MNDIAGKWGYSTDRERYYGSFDTREEAIEEARACEPDSGFFTAQFEDGPYSPSICADHIIDNLLDDAYSEIGEPAEDWLRGVTKEEKSNLELRLNNALADWMNDTGHNPRYFTVKTETEQEHAKESL